MRQYDAEEGTKTNWRLRSARFESQEALVAGIRRGEEPAMKELFAIYVPVLREEARRLNVPDAHREELAYTVLDDIVLRLAETPLAPPAITSYVINALRNRVRTEHRNAGRERGSADRLYSSIGVSPEAVVAECHSEYGIRISTGLESSAPAAARSAIERLAVAMTAELSQEELSLFVALNRHIPLRELAEEMGITYGAARVRLSRLRKRLAGYAVDYLDSLKETERHEVVRFLRRADIGVARGTFASVVAEPGNEIKGEKA